MKRIRAGALALALALAPMGAICAAPPAAALNDPECAADGTGSWNLWSSALGAELDAASAQEQLPAPLAQVRDDIICAWMNKPDGSVFGWREILATDVSPDTAASVVADFDAQGWDVRSVSLFVGDDGAYRPGTVADIADPPADLRYAEVYLSRDDGVTNVGLYYDPVGDWTWSTGAPTLIAEWGDGGSGAARAVGLADPSALSTLRTIAQAAPTPVQTGVIAGTAVILMLVVSWPAVLLDSVVSGRWQQASDWTRTRFAGFAARRRRRPAPRETGSPASDGTPRAAARGRRALRIALAWVGFAVAALVSGFIDPAFGPNLMSLRMLISTFLGFAVFNVGLFALTRWVVRRWHHDADPRLEFHWGSLGLVLLAVVLGRLIGLDPGIVFGLVAGGAYAVALTRTRDALVTLIGAGFAIAAGLVAWLGYSLMVPLAADVPAVLVATEFLSALTLEGVSALPLALLPLAALDGATVFRWSRWAWAGVYALGLGAFFLVLVTIPDSFGTIPGDFVRWVLVFACFAAASVGVWALDAWLTRRRSPAVSTPPEGVRSDSGTPAPS